MKSGYLNNPTSRTDELKLQKEQQLIDSFITTLGGLNLGNPSGLNLFIERKLSMIMNDLVARPPSQKQDAVIRRLSLLVETAEACLIQITNPQEILEGGQAKKSRTHRNPNLHDDLLKLKATALTLQNFFHVCSLEQLNLIQGVLRFILQWPNHHPLFLSIADSSWPTTVNTMMGYIQSADVALQQIIPALTGYIPTIAGKTTAIEILRRIQDRLQQLITAMDLSLTDQSIFNPKVTSNLPAVKSKLQSLYDVLNLPLPLLPKVNATLTETLAPPCVEASPMLSLPEYQTPSTAPLQMEPITSQPGDLEGKDENSYPVDEDHDPNSLLSSNPFCLNHLPPDPTQGLSSTLVFTPLDLPLSMSTQGLPDFSAPPK